MGYFLDIYKGIKTLLTGMSVTGKYFVHSRKGAITQQYPDNRETLKMFERFRGEVVMPHNENNDPTTGKKKKKIDQHIYHLGLCTMCGLCIEACPTDAIVWAQNYENSVYDRSHLTRVLNQPGSTLMPGVED